MQKGLGVGVLGIFQDFVHGAGFDDLAAKHHGNAVGNAADDAEIVRDEDDAHAQLTAEIGEEVHDLLLNGDIECGGGFVSDEELRLAAERHGDHHALLHAAAQLVRVGMQTLLRLYDAHFIEPAHDLGIAIRFGDIGAVQCQRLADLGADGEHGIEGGRRLLEDVGDLFAAHLAQFIGLQFEHVMPSEGHRGRTNRGGRLGQQAGEGEGGGAFPAAAFSDEGQGLALLEGEINALHGQRRLRVVATEFDFQIANVEERLGGHSATIKTDADVSSMISHRAARRSVEQEADLAVGELGAILDGEEGLSVQRAFPSGLGLGRERRFIEKNRSGLKHGCLDDHHRLLGLHEGEGEHQGRSGSTGEAETTKGGVFLPPSLQRGQPATLLRRLAGETDDVPGEIRAHLHVPGLLEQLAERILR